MATKPVRDDRVAILMALISQSDAACEAYMSKSITQANTFSSMLNVGSLGLSGLAGTIKPLGTSQALSTGATFATGTDAYLSGKVLGGNTPALIYRSVMVERTVERNRITRSVELGAEPLLLSADLQNYHNLCGVTVGINALGTAVSESERTAPTTGITKADAERDPFPKMEGMPFQSD